jgi:hypothetical protein
MVGGNGRERTWRLAARYADELNLDALAPDDLPEALSVIASRCEEIGRDPASLRVSLHVWWEQLPPAGARRVELLGRLGSLGLARVMTLVRESVDSDEALESFAADCAGAGVVLG